VCFLEPGLSLQQMLSQPTVLRTIKRIFDEHRFRYTLSDNGTEFEAEVTRFLAQRGVPRSKQLKAKTYRICQWAGAAHDRTAAGAAHGRRV
jgi:hypothetical protein